MVYNQLYMPRGRLQELRQQHLTMNKSLEALRGTI